MITKNNFLQHFPPSTASSSTSRALLAFFSQSIRGMKIARDMRAFLLLHLLLLLLHLLLALIQFSILNVNF